MTRLTVALLAILTIAVGFLAYSENRNATQITQVQANAAVVAAEQAQQAQIFDAVLVKFFNEENFICQELVAHNKVLGGPVPPPGICSVQAP